MSKFAKMIKFVSICLALACCAVFLLLGGVAESAPLPSADEKSLQEAERQRKAIMAQEALMRVWGYDKDGNSLYPKSFAGFWIEEDQLVIGITEYTDEEMGSYRDSAGAYAESLRFVERQYSYHDLDEETIKIGKYLMEKGAPVSQYYVDESENRIVIGLACEEAELSKWEALLEGEFERFPVAFTSLPYVQMATTYLVGGNALYNSSAQCTVTLSCCGTYNGSSAILTCGHYTQAYGNQIKDSNNNGNVIGTVVNHHFGEGISGDYEIISVNTSLFDITRSMAYYRSYDGYVSDPLVHDSICYYSRKAPGEYSGVVSARNQHVISLPNPQATTGVNVYGLTKIAVASGGYMTQGDSGGPVYRVDNNSAVYSGVIHGFSVENGNLYVFFTPYKYMAQAGFSAYVSD